MLAARAAASASRSDGLPPGSPPPMRAAVVMSRAILVKILPRFASSTPFLRLMVDHLLWPLMRAPPVRSAAAAPAPAPALAPFRTVRALRRAGARDRCAAARHRCG